MNYKIEASKGEVKIDFSITREEWEANLDKSYLKNKSRYNVPGFRKGHASRKMIERMYGEGVFFDDAFNSAFYDAYTKALDEHEEIFPVDDPQVDLGDINDEGVTFSAVVTVKPEVKLGAYKGIKIPAVEYNVTTDDVNAELDRVAKQASRKVEVTDRPVKDGDIVKLDYCGSVDGVRFDGGTASDQELTIGSHTFIPGFEEQMIGMNVGDVKDLNVTFPEEYHEKSLAGKPAVFNVVVKGISVVEVPEINDELIKDVSKFETVDEYRADVEKRLAEENARRADAENENSLIETVTETAEVDIPKCMIESQIDNIVRDMELRLSYMYRGMTLADYLKYTGSNLEDFRKAQETRAAHDVKIRLALEEIVKTESLDVTDEELDAEIGQLAEKAGKKPEEYKKDMDERTTLRIKNDLLMKKLIAFLKENNEFEVQVVEKDAPAKLAAKKSAAKKPATKKAAAEKTGENK